jgi:hypothetical protein
LQGNGLPVVDSIIYEAWQTPNLSKHIAIGLLTTTLPFKSNLTERPAFYDYCVRLWGAELLKGLE